MKAKSEKLAKSHLLLLNPPGKQVYLRDYYCSKVTQADYLNHPIDLVLLSGLLKCDYTLHLLDAIVDKLSVQESLRRIEDLQPEVIIGLTGSVSYAEDIDFYKLVRNGFAGALLLSGDILIDRRAARLKALDFATAFIHDFSSTSVARYLRGDRDGLTNLTYRANDRIVTAPIKRERKAALDLPVPEHDLFVDKPYRYPFVRRRKFATVLTEFGCPYLCTFCVMSTIGWRLRPVSDVLEEFDVLAKLGVREIFFLDQTFGIQPERTAELLRAMQARRPGFGWVCFSRPDLLSADLLRNMKQAGCHTIILGLESGNQTLLDAAKKAYTLQEVKDGFHLAARAGIRTVATVLIGLPQETMATFAQTLAFLEETGCDYASFNVAVPRMGTPLRDQALASGLIDDAFEIMDQSGSPAAMPGYYLSRQQIQAMQRSAVRQFYLNPRYVLKRLSAMRSVADFTMHARQGAAVLKKHMFGARFSQGDS